MNMQNKQMDDNAKQLGPEWKQTEPLHSGKCYAAGKVQKPTRSLSRPLPPKSLLVLAIMKTKNQKRCLKCVGRSERADEWKADGAGRECPKKTSKLLHNSLMLKSVQVVVFTCCKLGVRARHIHTHTQIASWLAKF